MGETTTTVVDRRGKDRQKGEEKDGERRAVKGPGIVGKRSHHGFLPGTSSKKEGRMKREQDSAETIPPRQKRMEEKSWIKKERKRGGEGEEHEEANRRWKTTR